MLDLLMKTMTLSKRDTVKKGTKEERCIINKNIIMAA